MCIDGVSEVPSRRARGGVSRGPPRRRGGGARSHRRRDTHIVSWHCQLSVKPALHRGTAAGCRLRSIPSHCTPLVLPCAPPHAGYAALSPPHRQLLAAKRAKAGPTAAMALQQASAGSSAAVVDAISGRSGSASRDSAQESRLQHWSAWRAAPRTKRAATATFLLMCRDTGWRLRSC